MTELIPFLPSQYLDNNGVPLAGGSLGSFLAGTSTPTPTYTDITGTTPNPNPFTLDASGRGVAWMDEAIAAYKFVIKDINGITILTIDNVQPTKQKFKTLGISPYTYPVKVPVTLNQAAAIVSGEAWDANIYSAIRYEWCSVQGSVVSGGAFWLLNSAGTWEIIQESKSDNGITSGLVWNLVSPQVGSIGQLTAAESGVGTGYAIIKKSTFPTTP